MTNLSWLKLRWLWVIIFITIFYIGFFIFSDFHILYEKFSEINLLFIPLILGARFASAIVKALRQKLFLNSLNIDISNKDNILTFLAGQSLIISPAASGTFIKSYILNKKFGHSYEKTIPVMITERFHDVLAPLSILAIFLLFEDFFEARIIIIVLSVGLVLFFFLLKNKKMLSKVLSTFSKLKIVKKFQENLERSSENLQILSNKKTMGLGWVLGIFAALIDGVGIYLGFVALGIDFTFIESFVSVYLPSIIGAISLIPGGFGVSEAGMLGMFIQLGLPVSIATSAVLFTRLTGVWFSFAIGAITNIFYLKSSK